MTGTNMRPASKSPPFLVVGLLVALGILAFNFWNLSSKSRDLKKQIDALHVDLRFESDKHLSVEKHASDLASKLSESSAKVTQMTAQMEEKEKVIGGLTNEVNKLKSELQTATTNLEESKKSAEQAQNEKNTIAGEMEKLKTELAEAKNVPTTCNQGQCKDVIRDLITSLTSQVAKASVGAALKDKQEVMGMIGDLLQGPDQVAKQPAAAQPALAAPAGQPQTQVVEQGPNVIQMQQPQAAAEGHAYSNQGGGGDGVGSESNRNNYHNNNVLAALRDQQQQQQQRQQQQQQQQRQQQQQQPQLQQQPPRDVLLDLSKQASASNNILGGLNPRAEGNAPQIVPQNIPQPGGDDGTANNAVIPNIANDVAAQEDVSDDRHLDLPEDEMDKQAWVNHGAEAIHGAEDLANLGNNLHAQLQDLSKNDRAVDENKEDDNDELEDKDNDEEIISQGKPVLAKDAQDEEGDYDEHDMERNEKQ